MAPLGLIVDNVSIIAILIIFKEKQIKSSQITLPFSATFFENAKYVISKN